jgi:hypothetical protein
LIPSRLFSLEEIGLPKQILPFSAGLAACSS